jgi:hypothetical protein
VAVAAVDAAAAAVVAAAVAAVVAVAAAAVAGAGLPTPSTLLSGIPVAACCCHSCEGACLLAADSPSGELALGKVV